MLFKRIKEIDFFLIFFGISILGLLSNEVFGQDTLVNKDQSFYNLTDTLLIEDLKQFVRVEKKHNTDLDGEKKTINQLGSFTARYCNLDFHNLFVGVYIGFGEYDKEVKRDSISYISFTFHHMFEQVPPIDFKDVYLDGLCSIEKNKKKRMEDYKVYRSIDKKRIYVHLVYENIEKEMCEVTYIFVYDKYIGRVFDKIKT